MGIGQSELQRSFTTPRRVSFSLMKEKWALMRGYVLRNVIVMIISNLIDYVNDVYILCNRPQTRIYAWRIVVHVVHTERIFYPYSNK